MKKQNLAYVAGAAVLIATGAWYFNANGAADKKPGAGKGGAQPPTTVSVITPVRQDVPVEIVANGTGGNQYGRAGHIGQVLLFHSMSLPHVPRLSQMVKVFSRDSAARCSARHFLTMP